MNGRAGNRLGVVAAILTAIALVAIAFFNLSFRLAQSQTITDVQASTGSSQNPSVQQIRGQHLLLYVEDRGPFSASLRQQLEAGLKRSMLCSGVEVIDKYDEQMANASIVVTTKDAADFYTPVYSTATLQVRLFYSSNGDLSLIRTGQFVFGRLEGEAPQPVVQSKQVIALADRTFGIVSYPGYYDYLASQAAEAVINHLETALSTT